MKNVQLRMDNSIRRLKKELAQDILKQRQKLTNDDPAFGGETDSGTGDCVIPLCDYGEGSGQLLDAIDMDDMGSGVYETPTPAKSIRKAWLDGLEMTEGTHYTVDNDNSGRITLTHSPIIPGTRITSQYYAL